MRYGFDATGAGQAGTGEGEAWFSEAELAWSVPQVRVAQGVGGAQVEVRLGTPPSGQRALGPHPVLQEILGTWGYARPPLHCLGF